jgi:hypothetical protein
MALNTVSGLATDVTISGFETADRLVINGLGGDDVIVVQERRLSQIYRLVWRDDVAAPGCAPLGKSAMDCDLALCLMSATHLSSSPNA